MSNLEDALKSEAVEMPPVEALEQYESIRRIQPPKSKELNKIFKKSREYIKMLIRGHANMVILVSSGGWGKTHTMFSVINEEGLVYGKDYAVLTTYTTPLSFFEFLYENRDKVVIIDDTVGVMEDPLSVSILKNAAWSVTGMRVLDYNSTTPLLNAPKRFIFTGRILIALNKRPSEDDKNIAALFSRAHVHDMDMTHAQKITAIQEIAKSAKNTELSKKQRMEVADYICDNANEATGNLNIRTLLKAFQCAEFTKNWKTLVDELISPDNDMLAMKQAIEGNRTVAGQIKTFTKMTGKGARTFYRLKSQLKKLVGVK
jgi:gas vesicle protein